MIDWHGVVKSNVDFSVVVNDVHPKPPLDKSNKTVWFYLPTGQLVYSYVLIRANEVVLGIIDGECIEEQHITIDSVNSVKIAGWGEFDSKSVPNFESVIPKSNREINYIIPNFKHWNKFKKGTRNWYHKNKCLSILLETDGLARSENSRRLLSVPIYFEFRWFNGKLELKKVYAKNSSVEYYLNNNGYYRISGGNNSKITIVSPDRRKEYKTTSKSTITNVQRTDDGIVVSSREWNDKKLIIGLFPGTTFECSIDCFNYRVDRHFLLFHEHGIVKVINMLTNTVELEWNNPSTVQRLLAYVDDMNILLFYGDYGVESYRNDEHLILYELNSGNNMFFDIYRWQWFPDDLYLVIHSISRGLGNMVGLQIVMDE